MDAHAFGWLGFASYLKYCAHLVLEGFRASERILDCLKKMFIRLGRGTLVLLLQPPQIFRATTGPPHAEKAHILSVVFLDWH